MSVKHVAGWRIYWVLNRSGIIGAVAFWVAVMTNVAIMAATDQQDGWAQFGMAVLVLAELGVIAAVIKSRKYR